MPAHKCALLTIKSGQTQRWHMHPFMPPQSVGDHAWRVATILGLIDPNCTVDELKTALFHDVAELNHGDLSTSSNGPVWNWQGRGRNRGRKPYGAGPVARGGTPPAMKIAGELADL